MLAKPIVEITLSIQLTPNSDPIIINLFFTKQPTKNQVIEATRFFLTDQEFLNDVALSFMHLVKNTELPTENDVSICTNRVDGKIYNCTHTTILFDNK